jgi:hypothetical protein
MPALIALFAQQFYTKKLKFVLGKVTLVQKRLWFFSAFATYSILAPTKFYD